MESTRPRSPRFLQRSRSGTPRLCHLSPAPEPVPPLSPNLPRSKSAAKTRQATTNAVDGSGRRKPKENRVSPAPRRPPSPDSGGNARWARHAAIVPSAWALSPGRLPAKAVEPMQAVRQRGGGVLGLFRRRKEPSAREEAAHQLRMLSARLMQWRFTNARAAAAMAAATSKAEKSLFLAWLRLNELRNVVAAKRILIQRRRHKMKLFRILNPQIHLLNQWEPVAKRNFEAVGALGRVLGAACLSLPLIEGAQANMASIHRHICMAMDVMKKIEDAIRIFYYKVEKISSLLSELVTTIRLEMDGLDELMNTSRKADILEMHEMSLRANLIQAMKELTVPTHLSRLSCEYHVYFSSS